MTGAIDPLPVEVVEGAKLKLRLQEAEEQYNIAHETFMNMFDAAWNEVLSKQHDKYGEFVADDNDALHSICKSNIAEKGFKIFIEHEPNYFKRLCLCKWFWQQFVEYELDNLLKKKEEQN